MTSNQCHVGKQLVRSTLGFALLDVLLAIVVFAVGMLAIASLQTNLTRSSVDANTRTVATNIGEEILERLRTFRRLKNSTTGEDVFTFEDIDDEYVANLLPAIRGGTGNTLTVEGQQFTIFAEVRGFAFEGETAVDDESSVPPFKRVTLRISWNENDDRAFNVDESAQISRADIGTGEVTLVGVIPAIPAIGSAVIASTDFDGKGGVTVAFDPNTDPDVIALKLFDGGNNPDKFKESSRPKPTVLNSGGVRETWFDVRTYNRAGIDDPVFLRREEFIVVNCECILRQAVGDGEGGFRPTVWNGIEYVEGEFVKKDYGENPSGRNDPMQSVLCDTCCRDHHDGGVGQEDDSSDVGRFVYDPWGAPNSIPRDDHEHFKYDGDDLVPASYGDRYQEACRLVRKDGFFRVAQDFNRQAMFGFPQDGLDNSSEVADYSEYVVESVDNFVKGDLKNFKQPGDSALNSDYLVPASSPDAEPIATAPTNLPTPLGNSTQQLQSRGIYVDYVTNELKTNLNNCPGSNCKLEGYSTPLEFYPFFEIQLTNLSRWAETPANFPVDVENELFLDTTGLASHQEGGVGPSEIDIVNHRRNQGFIGMEPIWDTDQNSASADYVTASLYIETVEGIPDPVRGFRVSGDITRVAGVPANVKASNTEITFEEAECNRTPLGYECIVPQSGPSYLTVRDTKTNVPLYFCSGSGSLTAADSNSAPYDSWATFVLPTANDNAAHIDIQDLPCS